jgi:hypothetical protein
MSWPLLLPKVNVTLFAVVGNDVMLAPAGKVHAYVEPAVLVTLYTLPVDKQIVVEPAMAEVVGKALTVMRPVELAVAQPPSVDTV